MRHWLAYHVARLIRWAARRTWRYAVLHRLPLRDRFQAACWLDEATTRAADAAEALTHARSR